MTLGNALDEPRERGRLYGALALSFYPPDADAARLRRAMMLLSGALSSDESARGAVEGGPSVDPDVLEREYNRLFVGPGHVVCPPYESVHVSEGRGTEGGLVLGPPAFAVQSSYREAGLDLAAGFTDLPDHMAVELEFMKYLCDKEAESNDEERAQWRSRQAKFISGHLGRWAAPFADCVAKNSTSPYYRAAARVLKEFTEEESKSIASPEGERSF